MSYYINSSGIGKLLIVFTNTFTNIFYNALLTSIEFEKTCLTLHNSYLYCHTLRIDPKFEKSTRLLRSNFWSGV